MPSRPAMMLGLLLAAIPNGLAAQERELSQPPEVPMAGAFDNLVSGDAPASGAAWWRDFNDPVLDALIETAMRGNFTIAEAAARLDRARAGIRAADGTRLPAIGVDAEAGYARLSREDPQLGPAAQLPGFERNQDRYAATIGATWELDLFGRLGARSREARADALASAAGLEAARLAVTTEIAERYITLRLLQQRRGVAEARAAALGELARLSALRVERGVSAPVERDRLLAELETARAVVPALQTAIEEQYARIDVLLAREIGTSRRDLAAPTGLPAARVIDLSATPAELLGRRPDILAAYATLVARDAGVAAAQRDRLPRFNLGGLIGTIAGAINPLFGAAAFTAQGSGGVSYTASDGGRSRAAVDAARAEVDEATAAYQRTVLSAIADVEAAGAARDGAAARAAGLREAERRLEATLDAVRLGEARGAVALVDVLDVDRRLQDARDARLVAEADEALASIALVRALGGAGASQTELAGAD
ncbi:efflux transporter outer membrane subunit [Qipengyuania qiaonensis]|uniref:TolC family protein n=1 Tax=Qipengyuania qiaonensis TaxID=2867240 RepID=A0ABS7J6Q1_9SPHN|nr:TolC family protein [Qipengyuania qiaonensis]MBX7481665.1 TolC family protein [Qipengyuania qiaonensis]